MEDLIKKLDNTLATKKGSWPITIKGNITNADGSFEYILQDPLQFDNDATYLVWLWNFTGWSNFPNVLAEGPQQNNMFYYSIPADSKIKVISIPTSLHGVGTYNDFLHRKLLTTGHILPADKAGGPPSYPISLTYDLPTQRIVLIVKEGYKVHFEKEKTWRQRLGFNAREYGKGEHTAENRADILETLNIFISADICSGWSYKGSSRNILYAMVNCQPAGTMLVERPNPPVRVLLNKKEFSSITLRFFTDDEKPVTFQGEEFILNLVIERL